MESNIHITDTRYTTTHGIQPSWRRGTAVLKTRPASPAFHLAAPSNPCPCSDQRPVAPLVLDTQCTPPAGAQTAAAPFHAEVQGVLAGLTSCRFNDPGGRILAIAYVAEHFGGLTSLCGTVQRILDKNLRLHFYYLHFEFDTSKDGSRRRSPPKGDCGCPANL